MWLIAKNIHLTLQAAGLGSSPLAQQLLGLWARAPKQARDEYERFIRTVSSLLGGEASSEEVQVALLPSQDVT